ncbi:hypothetical protein GYH30_020654 [Glycine max]|uniref:Uncharacterized protein n=1 Tax=Glycine max TaxID=3847 RepID=A0A0R0ITT1_SOYBN|nr:hypothetical protein GYH30_020654 [Glycine max]
MTQFQSPFLLIRKALPYPICKFLHPSLPDVLFAYNLQIFTPRCHHHPRLSPPVPSIVPPFGCSNVQTEGHSHSSLPLLTVSCSVFGI